ncbi:MAG: hypothetical protein HYW80_00780 [Parcubacteria group bacterium]|nr:hypothetical protein [Parcubacteria group bacterium]
MPTPNPTPSYFLAAFEIFRLLFSSPEVQWLIFFLKIFSWTLSIFFAVGIVVLVRKLNMPKKYRAIAKEYVLPGATPSKTKFQDEFEKIKTRLALGKEEEDRLALAEADRLLDLALRSLGYEGETVVEKLSQIKPAHLKNTEEAFLAHEIRNREIHEPTQPLEHHKAEEAILLYEKILRELGMLG